VVAGVNTLSDGLYRNSDHPLGIGWVSPQPVYPAGPVPVSVAIVKLNEDLRVTAQLTDVGNLPVEMVTRKMAHKRRYSTPKGQSACFTYCAATPVQRDFSSSGSRSSKLIMDWA